MPLPNVGVVGVGSMGALHARVFSSLAHLCTLRGVFDLDNTASGHVAQEYHTTAIDRFEDLVAEVDALSIAVPTSAHYEMACAAIEAGKHVLIEKPIAATTAEGADLVARAQRKGVILQVGHVERFNPAIGLLPQILADKRIVALDFHRMSPYSPRIFDADVVSDLMIHDIDILRNLVPARLQRIEAAGVAHSSKLHADYVVATLTFDGGIIANLTASRLTEQKIRTLSITALEAYVELDFLERRILINRATQQQFSGGGAAYRQESVIEKVYVPNREPLVAEIESFLHCVRTGEEPLVSGHDGVAALEIVEQIQSRVNQDPVPPEPPAAPMRPYES